jgi:hypothetical protein
VLALTRRWCDFFELGTDALFDLACICLGHGRGIVKQMDERRDLSVVVKRAITARAMSVWPTITSPPTIVVLSPMLTSPPALIRYFWLIVLVLLSAFRSLSVARALAYATKRRSMLLILRSLSRERLQYHTEYELRETLRRNRFKMGASAASHSWPFAAARRNRSYDTSRRVSDSTSLARMSRVTVPMRSSPACSRAASRLA